MSFHFSSLSASLSKYQEQFRCVTCQQIYFKTWFHQVDQNCYFCKRFNPKQHTYQTLLREIEWCFIQSGENNQDEFYNNYIEYLYDWCNYYHIHPTKEDIKNIEELYKK